MTDPKKLFLLDAFALIYRAYFAFAKNPRINSKGQNTSAIFGFANTLIELLRREKPTHIAVVFDTSTPTERHIIYPEYKAHRERMPEDISTAIPYIFELIKAFNIPTLSVDGFEADDVIGTLAKKGEKLGYTTYMMTPDKDFGQLVSDHIFMYKPARMGNDVEIWGVPEILNRFNIKRPDQVIDLLGLMGDVSDNIPGIAGVGEKTAIKLIEEFDTMENLLANTDKLKGKLRENVERCSELALLSKKLATIIIDVPIEFDEKALVYESANFEKLNDLFNELEFRNMINRLQDIDPNRFASKPIPPVKVIPPVIKAPTNQLSLFDEPEELLQVEEKVGNEMDTVTEIIHDYQLIDTPEKQAILISRMEASKEFCFDTETTGIDANNAEIVGMSIALKAKEAFYIRFSDNYQEAVEQLKPFKSVFADETIRKIGQNLKYDISILNWYDIPVKGPLFDTMIAHYLLEPDMRHNMDFLAETYLNYSPVSITKLIGKKGKGQLSMRDVPIEEQVEYAAEDADITLQLKEVFEPKLRETSTMDLFMNIEMPLITVLSGIETEGAKIDKVVLGELSVDLSAQLREIENAIYAEAGEHFNISSPKQLGDILFDKLGIDDGAKKTKTEQYATGEEVLQKLEGKHPIIEKILEFRSLKKLLSTYIDTLPLLINPRTNRVHTSFNQAVAATGRLSSTNPNLQNIPIRTERGREIRKAFVPRNANFQIVSADYSQIELRIIAAISKDESMIEAFENGLDIHTATAAKVYAVELADVTKDMRRNAKMVNFGIIYGISAFGLAQRLSISRSEAAELIKQYFEQYPKIKQYMDNTILEARDMGYVTTLLGRRRYLRDINSNNATVRGYSERNAINAPIQGSAADIIKIAMINIFQEFQKLNLRSKMIIQVHDELVFDVHVEELDTVKAIITDKMSHAVKLVVPLDVEIGAGLNWLEAH